MSLLYFPRPELSLLCVYSARHVAGAREGCVRASLAPYPSISRTDVVCSRTTALGGGALRCNMAACDIYCSTVTTVAEKHKPIRFQISLLRSIFFSYTLHISLLDLR